MNADKIQVISVTDYEVTFGIREPVFVHTHDQSDIEYNMKLYTMSMSDIKEIVDKIIDRDTICRIIGDYMNRDGMSIILQGAEIYDKCIKEKD